ncbi:MAG: N-acetylmuramoyl-L-alanine amidase [Lewinellaceae bacterium]|nr:N-acetylmuramoyl-L-alanine amidase [Lewinellaceae bacterium]
MPWHELNCESATAEALTAVTDEEGEPTVAKGSNTYPIFGKKYQKTPNVSTKLKGHVFYVISGHGGPDVGAQGTRAGHTLCEDEYAYDVALRLARLLLSHGAIVYILVRDPDDGIRDDNYLKCDKDEYAWGNKAIPLDQKERLKQRTDIVNELYKQHLKVGRKEQTLIEIHVDSRTRNHRTDVYFYYRPGSAESKALAVRVHKTFLQKYLKARTGREYNGSVSERGLYTLRETRIPNAVYVELANIRNDWDQQRLVITSNRQALANWMCEALMSK